MNKLSYPSNDIIQNCANINKCRLSLASSVETNFGGWSEDTHEIWLGPGEYMLHTISTSHFYTNNHILRNTIITIIDCLFMKIIL